MTTKRFVFTFEVSNQFRRRSPVAGEYIEIAKRQIAAKVSATGPRGGMYRLVTAPDEWRESQDDGYDAFIRNVTVFGTKREGRYVRPDRITPDLMLGEAVTFDTLTAPVVEGLAVLPDGRTVETQSPFVAFPVVTS